MAPNTRDNSGIGSSSLGLQVLQKRPSNSSRKPITIESAESYAKVVADHADSSSGRSLYSGVNYDNFATYLQRPFQPKTCVDASSSVAEPTSTSAFLTLHDLSLPESDETRIHQFSSPELFQAVIDEKKKQAKPSLLVFLRGHPSPEWLVTIGYACNVDPEFLLRHLDFRIPPAMGYFTSPALPSTTRNIIKLRLPSIIYRYESGSGDQVEIEQLRENARVEMKDYFGNLKREMLVNTGDSIVRAFHVHDHEHFSLEQDASICVNDFEKGWIGIIWLDNGNDLTEGPPGPWSAEKLRSRSWKQSINPTILHRPNVALKAPHIVSRHIKTDQAVAKPTAPRNVSGQTQPDRSAMQTGTGKYYQQLGCSIHAYYGRFLDEKAAGADAFYALSEMFSIVATSEAQWLNMVESKIVSEMSSSLEAVDGRHNITLSNLLYNKRILDDHVRRLRENIASIEDCGGPRWPKAKVSEHEQEVFNKVKMTNSVLRSDFEYLLKRAKTLSQACDRGMDIAGNNAMVAESRSAKKQAQWVGKLTLLAFFYIPASFTTSLFGMNLKQFGQGSLGVWIWIVVLIPTYAVSLFFLYFNLSRIKEVFKKEKVSNTSGRWHHWRLRGEKAKQEGTLC